MIRRNIDASLGLVNGTIAKVVSIIHDDPSYERVDKIRLLLPSGQEYCIERVNVKFQVIDKAYVTRKQFPLSLSYGITIHKSQGLSLQTAIMDIGNSVFDNGQAYVALSRVTSSEGLHLINFDPSSVQANDEAIIEYNRLKGMHKTKTELLNISKYKYSKVKDTIWVLPKMITSHHQQLHDKVEKGNVWVMRGLQNDDKASCYTNAVLQCLIHLHINKKFLNDSDNQLNDLSILADRYEKKLDNLNTSAIRQCFGDSFLAGVKQDVAKFFTSLCIKFNYIRKWFEFQISSTKRSCENCASNNVISNERDTCHSFNIIFIAKWENDEN